MPVTTGKLAICVNPDSDFLVHHMVYQVLHIRESGGILVDASMPYFRASRFAPYHPYIYLRGRLLELHPNLYQPVSTPSRFDDVYDSRVGVPLGGLSMDPYMYGVSARTSNSRPQSSLAIDNAIARLREDSMSVPRSSGEAPIHGSRGSIRPISTPTSDSGISRYTRLADRYDPSDHLTAWLQRVHS